MKERIYLSLFFLFSVIGWSQEKTITGVVTSESDKMPMPGVSVVVKGTSRGVATDFDGKYQINAKEGEVLVFSFVGFHTEEKKVVGGGKSLIINVLLKEEASQLEEVVVTAYGGTQKKTKVTSSVASVKAETLSTGSFANPGLALSGAVAGLRVAQTSGQPGSQASFVLRGGTNWDGTGSPLVIVDGQLRGSLSDINPNDIESMDLLKDAGATAIYGARASNGVIMVTTKRGKTGNSELSVKLKHSFDFLNSDVEFLDARGYLYWQRRAYHHNAHIWQRANGSWVGWAPLGNLDQPRALGTGNIHFVSKTDNTVVNPNVDYRAVYTPMLTENLSAEQKQILLSQGWETMIDPAFGKEIIFKEFDYSKVAFKPFALTRDYSFSATGGNDKGKYYAGLGYFHQEGLPITDWYKRLTGVLNADYKLRDWLTSASNFSISYANWESPIMGYSAYFSRMLGNSPTQKEYTESGDLVIGARNRLSDYHPLYLQGKFLRDNSSNKINFGQSFKAEILKNLDFTVSGQVIFDESYAESFNKDYQRFPGTAENVWVRSRNSSASFGRTLRQTYNAILNYKMNIESHNFDAMLGYEYFDSYYRGLSASGSGAPTDDFQDLALTSSDKDKRGIDTGHVRSRIKSYFGRLNYDYADKYLLSFTLRRDGFSSLLDNRWGTFPGVSAGWIISREEFLPENVKEIVSFAKLRSSFGMNGNASGIGEYYLQGSYASNKYQGNVGYQIGALRNSGLRWERTRTFEVGLDLGFINNRINTNVVFYDRLTEDKYASIQLPHSLGFSSFTNNNGTFRNRGVEIEASFRIIDKNDLRWDLGVNAAYNINKVVKLPNNDLPNNRQGAFEVYAGSQKDENGNYVKEWVGGYQEGQTPGDLYVYEAIGIYQSEEHIRELSNNLVDESPGNKKLYGPQAWANLSENEKNNGWPIQPGDVIWRDVNGDGKIDRYDLVKVGNVIPKWTGGITTSIAYKNLRLSARLDYALGFVQSVGYDAEGSLLWFMMNGQGEFGVPKQALETWTPDNPNAKYPRYDFADIVGKRNYTRGSSMFTYKGDYLSFREVALSYSFDKDMMKKVGLTGLELSLVGQNLGYLTQSEAYSPEALRSSTSGYPLPRTIILGLNVTF